MTSEAHRPQVNIGTGYQPIPGSVEQGYQPSAIGPVDPKALNPPKGGSAIQPPPQPAADVKK